MACPQCGSEVPADDAFCGKCGYAMREGAPERVDQSRIRVHEEPDPMETSKTGSSQQRVRHGTMVGMPAVTPGQAPAPPAASQSPPTELSAARQRAKKRTPQKTMLGVPRPDIVPPPNLPAPPDDAAPADDPAEPSDAEESARPPRERARVRYDSVHEPFPALQRRKKALRGLLVLIVIAGGWFVYRFLTLNG